MNSAMKKLMMIMCGVAMVAALNAKPAFRGPINRVQPDGSVITIYQHGDECFHWLTNAKGEWLMQDAEGKYVKTAALSDEEITAQRKASRYYIPQTLQQAQPTNLAPRGLIILVNFQDEKFRSENTLEVMRDMHNGENYTFNYEYIDPYTSTREKVVAKGSARQYFIDQSCGQYQPYFDVVGPYTVEQNMAYYGGNAGGQDKYPHIMVKEACELAHNDGVDFSQYDNDKDGFVDFVYVIYAGYGEADGGGANTIWPHSWNIYTKGGISLKLDGKQVDLYACSSEMNAYSYTRAGIATFCHEFSHVLGLPDFYPTGNSNTHKTSGSWDIMDYGPYNNDGNTPPAYSGYERMFFGWATPRVLNSAADVTIKELQEYNDVCVVTTTGKFNGKANDPNPTEFYVVENRQKKGWDTYLPGHGMLLTKIRYSYDVWKNNRVNYRADDLHIDLIEADGLKPTYSQSDPDNGYMGKPGDAFPAGATSYADISGYPITEISEANSEIQFKMKGGGTETHTDIVRPTNITVDKTDITLTEAKRSETITATVDPENVTYNNVIWTSSDINVATVHEGVVTAVKRGNAVITAYIHASDAKATVNVFCDLPAGIENVGSMEKNTARKVLENGHVVIIRDGVKYSLLGEQL